MSKVFNYDDLTNTEFYDRERYPAGADVIAGLLHVHCGKPLQELHILDAGCGTGQYAEALTNLGVGKVSLLDASEVMLDVAKEKLKNICMAVVAKLPDLPFEDRTFDAVMFNLVLHHIEENAEEKGFPGIQETLHNTKRTLRPHGVLIITTVLPAIQRESIWIMQYHEGANEKMCKVFPSTEQFLAMFVKCGFQCVSAMNFLSKATKMFIPNYCDHEAPLKEDWRKGTCMFQLLSDTDTAEVNEILLTLNRSGQLKQFMIEHDRTSEFGMLTLFVCIST